MIDLKHCKPAESLSFDDKIGAIALIIAIIGSVLFLNFSPLEWIK